jgi:hypothetical protein
LDVSLLGTVDSLEGIEGMAFSKGPVIVLDVSLLGTVDSLEGIEGMAFSKGPVIVLDVSLLGTVDSLEGIVLDVSLLGVCLINCLFIKFKFAFAISDLPLSIAPTVSRISNIESRIEVELSLVCATNR